MKIGIVRYGAYLPKYILERKKIAEAWDFPSIPGGIAVRNVDEDSITMAVEAGLDCLGLYDPAGMVDLNSIDGLYFGTTTAPYTEKECAPIIAEALDLRTDILTMDVTDTTRAGTIALMRAYETIKAGKAHKILVIGSDMQSAMPESMYEYQYGDGAAALLISDSESDKVVLSIEDYYSVSDNVIGPWRRREDDYTRSFQGKHEVKFGYMANMLKAINGVLSHGKIEPKSIKKAAIYSPDPRMGSIIGKKVGLTSKAIENSPFLEFGNTGNAFAMMILILAIKRARTSDLVLFASYGDGADAFIFKVEDKEALINLRRICRGVTQYKNSVVELKNYGAYLSRKKLLKTERYTRKSSAIRIWRDSKFLNRFYGMKCKVCGTMQYPIWRACMVCGAKDQSEEVKLAKRGTIYTFTLDHLQGGNYYETPIPRCVVDLDGGGRVLLDMTDVENPEAVVKVGMRVELTYRWVHPGENFHNYYWRCRPIRVGDDSNPPAGSQSNVTQLSPEKEGATEGKLKEEAKI
ncbi:MAG: OB-fold domain-containing protein [Promethearchaeota archaeon]